MKWNPDQYASQETKAAIERLDKLGRDLNAVHPRKYIDELTQDDLDGMTIDEIAALPSRERP